MINRFKHLFLSGGLLVIFLTPGCSLLVDDSTPAVMAATQMEDIGTSALDTVEELVSNAAGLDAVKKAELLRKVDDERKKLSELSDALRDLLITYGSVDWKQVADSAYELYKKYRSDK
jgi:hypothetical protein